MSDPYLPGHGDTAYDVLHYDLGLTYSLEGNQLHGIARLRVVAREPLTTLRLDLHHLRATKVLLPGRRVQRFDTRRGHLVIKAAGSIDEGTEFDVVVHYRGKPGIVKDRAGEAGWEELTDGALVAGQPGGAPAWFPCNDRPANKATYRFEVTVPSDYLAVANGELTRRYRSSSTSTWSYELDKPMPTYLASLQIGRYVEVEQESPVPITGIVPSGQRSAFEKNLHDHPAIMEFFVRTFGEYPFAGYRVVFTDDDLEIPLEAGGFSTFGANFLSRDWDAQRLIAHELAHQWFGNSLTLGTWRDIWLHEGFACYSEWLWSQECGDDTTQERAERHHRKLQDAPQDLVLSDPGPDDMFDDRVYKRGALTLHALRLTVGDDAFFSLLREWTAEHAHSTVDTAQFRAFAAQQTGHDLDELFTDWLDRPELPELPTT